MKSGDPKAVGMMFQFLKPSAEQAGFAISKLKAQLLNEYGVDVDNLPGGPGEKISTEEEDTLKEMVAKLQGLGIDELG
jgi:hypothetical protein